MKKSRNNKGVTLIVLTITIIVLLIITSITIYNSKRHLAMKRLNDLYSDIESISTKVSDYYLSNNSLPIYENAYLEDRDALATLLTTNGGSENIINVNDKGKYYVLNLSKMDNLTLNYGREYSNWNSSTQDLYIINEVTHQIYYPEGIKYRDKMYFSEDIDKNIINKVEVGTITTNEPTISFNKINKNTIELENKITIESNITLTMDTNFQKDSLKYAWEVENKTDTNNIIFTEFSLDGLNSATLMSKKLDNLSNYYLYIKVLDNNGDEHIIKQEINDTFIQTVNENNIN